MSLPDARSRRSERRRRSIETDVESNFFPTISLEEEIESKTLNVLGLAHSGLMRGDMTVQRLFRPIRNKSSKFGCELRVLIGCMTTLFITINRVLSGKIIPVSETPSS